MLGVKLEGRTGLDSDFVDFEMSEVNYVQMISHKSNNQLPVYYTSHGMYAPLLTLKDIAKANYPSGFRHMDKSTVVNRHRIKKVERSRSELIIVFVDDCRIRVSPRSRYN